MYRAYRILCRMYRTCRTYNIKCRMRRMWSELLVIADSTVIPLQRSSRYIKIYSLGVRVEMLTFLTEKASKKWLPNGSPYRFQRVSANIFRTDRTLTSSHW